MIRSRYYILLFIFINFVASAQTYNGKNVQWTFTKPDEPRLKLRFGTAGINIGGYEGTSVVTENITDKTLLVELALQIKDLCGNITNRKVSVKVKPYGKVGGDTWMGGSEQLDYSSKCSTFKTYGDNFKTRISDVVLSIVSVKDVATGNTSQNGLGQVKSGKDEQPSSGSNTYPTPNKGTMQTDLTCPIFNIDIDRTPGYNCVSLKWAAIPTGTISVDENGGNLKTPTQIKYSFIVQHRESGSAAWIENQVNRSGIVNFNLASLNPCSMYEVRLITVCNGKVKSAPSGTLFFNTSCQAPTKFQIIDVTTSTASITSRRPNPVRCGPSISVSTVVEYKANSSAWETMVCPNGAPCTLTSLLSDTGYRIRIRYKYGNKFFSEYSNELNFRTK